MKYPECVNCVVQIGPMQPNSGKRYPVHLAFADATLAEVSAQLGELQKQRESEDPVAFCKKFWAILRVINVANRADAGKIDWGAAIFRMSGAPYGGGREWALLLPNARLLTVKKAGHGLWIEAPDEVLGSIDAFLGGSWPEAAQKVISLDPFEQAAG